jgi:Mn2+/Fe2+ NRAMP family transporter
MSEPKNKTNTDVNKPAVPAKNTSIMLGAALLMATSAIGPGFLTQTSNFTAKYLSSFAFVIVMVIIMDMIAQTNIWSIVGPSGMRAQEIANKVLPGLGYFLIVLVVIGGLAFNIGNVGGVALGFNAMIGLNEKIGAALGGALAICIFLSKGGKSIVDRFAQIMGGIIICIMLYVCFASQPPVGQAVVRIFTPEKPGELFAPMLTLLGGSCGGYITFSGAHRLLDAGYGGNKEDVSYFRKSVLTGISVSGTVRILLFLAVLGVCTAGSVAVTANIDAIKSAANPAAQAFELAIGSAGRVLFGIGLFAAGITSVIGAAYTSVTFLSTLHPFIKKNDRWFIIGFIAFSTLIMVILGGAKRMVILAGAVNGLILPISLASVLLAAHKKNIVGEYKHPVWLSVLGWIVAAIAAYLAITALPNLANLFK